MKHIPWRRGGQWCKGDRDGNDVTRQGMQAATRSWKKQGADSLLVPSEGTSYDDTLISTH